MNRPVVLAIAGFDPSSGAGITADLKTIAAHGCYGVSCITSLTVQSTEGVKRIDPLAPGLVIDTLDCLATDLEFAAVKIGMLGNSAVAAAVEGFLIRNRPANVVLDPVLVSSSGVALLDEEGITLLRERLMPLADVVTPNLEEAAVLACGQAMVESRWRLAMGLVERSRHVVITCGSLDPPVDVLLMADGRQFEYFGQHLNSTHTHGTGCAFSTSLACWLALGRDLPDAVASAKNYVAKGLAQAYSIGKGIGPLNHFPDPA